MDKSFKVMQKLDLNIRKYLKYKFLNSLFLGLSVGAIFVLYTPLMPWIYSLGGILLALSMLVVAKLYYKILNIEYFYKISLFIEFTLLFVMLYFLLNSYNYLSAMVIYIGYQITFTFGSYLVRAETLLLKKAKFMELVDVTKQKGYLLGMLLSYLFYMALEHYADITEKEMQVYYIHFVLVLLQIVIIISFIKSFRKTL